MKKRRPDQLISEQQPPTVAMTRVRALFLCPTFQHCDMEGTGVERGRKVELLFVARSLNWTANE